MATEKQVEANRRNAQLSTGPRTEAGKEISRANAVRHGMRAETLEVLPTEDPAEFAARLEAWERDLEPVGEAESHLVRHAAAITWKLDRAERHEAASLSRRIHDAVASADCDDDDLEAIEEAAAIASFDPSIEGERLRRHLSGLTREMHRTLDALVKLVKERHRRANEANSAAKVASARRPAPPAPNEANSRGANEANRPTARQATGGIAPTVPPFDARPYGLELAPSGASSTGWIDFSIDRA